MIHSASRTGPGHGRAIGYMEPAAAAPPAITKVPKFVRPHETDERWRDRAACRGTNSDLFFGLDGERATERDKREDLATAFCKAHCPVMLDCRSWALESGQDAGVWGGMSEDERRTLKRRIARQASREGRAAA